MVTTLARLAWAAVVMGAGWGLAHGLWLSTYFERTEQARIDDAQGEVRIWVATLVLPLLALLAGAPMLLLSVGATLVHRPVRDATREHRPS